MNVGVLMGELIMAASGQSWYVCCVEGAVLHVGMCERSGMEREQSPSFHQLTVRLRVVLILLLLICYKLTVLQLHPNLPHSSYITQQYAGIQKEHRKQRKEQFEAWWLWLLYKDNIQMQFSKSDGGQLIGKIERLKEEINAATQYADLEKCMHRLAKLRERASAVLEKRRRKQLKEMCDVAQGVIHLKTKKFKRRIIDQIAKESQEQDRSSKQNRLTSKEKTLKYSKSMDCFDLAAPPKVTTKPEEQDSWQDKTEINPRNRKARLQRRVEELEDQLASYKRQMSKIEQGRNSATITQLCLRLGEQEGLFEQQLGFRAREKALQADQLRERLRRSEERATQLKNRLLNEQKRQQDYIKGLKNQLTSSGQQLEAASRQNRRLQEELNKVYFVCDGYKAEVKRLMEDLEQLQRQRRHAQQNQLLRMKDNSIRRELQTLQLQQKYMREMESLLQAEKDQNSVLQTKVDQLQRRNVTLQQESNQLQAQNERLQEMLQIREEQESQIKKQMLLALQAKNVCAEELAEARSIIKQLENQIANNKQRRSMQLQRKAESLKQIKQILQAK